MAGSWSLLDVRSGLDGRPRPCATVRSDDQRVPRWSHVIRTYGLRPFCSEGSLAVHGLHDTGWVSLRRSGSSCSRASSGRTSCASRTPPARATSCWTRSSASRSSRSQRCWSATPRSYRAMRRLERLAAGLELGDGPLELGEGLVEREASRSRRQSSGCDRLRHRVSSSGSVRRSRRGAMSIPSPIPTPKMATATTTKTTSCGHHDAVRPVAGSSPAATRTARRRSRPAPRPGRARSPRRPSAARSRSRARACAWGASTSSAAVGGLQSGARDPRPARRCRRVEPVTRPGSRAAVPARARAPRAPGWRGRAAGPTARGPASAGPTG